MLIRSVLMRMKQPTNVKKTASKKVRGLVLTCFCRQLKTPPRSSKQKQNLQKAANNTKKNLEQILPHFRKQKLLKNVKESTI